MNAYGTTIVQSNKDLLYDLLCKELEGKYDIEDIKKKWKELVKKFKNEHAKASVKPSGAGTSEIYKPSWVFYEHLKYLTVICDDTDDTVNTIDRGPSKPRAKKVSKQQQREAREERKLELFSEAVSAMREPETTTCKGQNTLLENSEVAAFANYMHLTLSKFNPRKFRRAKRCIGDILFQLEESDELEATNATPSRFNTYGRYSPAPSMPSSYGSNKGMPMTVLHENMQLHSYPNQSSEYY